MKAIEAAETFEKIAKEIRYYLAHPCYAGGDIELKMLINSVPKSFELNRVNHTLDPEGMIVHGGFYQDHLLIGTVIEE